MYTLINAQRATMYELKNVYTLDEALKLWSLYEMELDVERGRNNELERRMNRR